MRDPFPFLHMSYEQISLLTAQLLVYHQYLQRKIKPSVKRDHTLRVLLALLRRLSTLVVPNDSQTAFLLTVEEVSTIKEALAVLQRALEAKRPSAGRDQEIQRLATMRTLIEQTFPAIQDA
jgi:hypothetical protein